MHYKQMQHYRSTAYTERGVRASNYCYCSPTPVYSDGSKNAGKVTAYTIATLHHSTDPCTRIPKIGVRATVYFTRLRLGRQLVNLLPAAQRTNSLRFDVLTDCIVLSCTMFISRVYT